MFNTTSNSPSSFQFYLHRYIPQSMKRRSLLALVTSLCPCFSAGSICSISGASRVLHQVNSPQPSTYLGILSETQATWCICWCPESQCRLVRKYLGLQNNSTAIRNCQGHNEPSHTSICGSTKFSLNEIMINIVLSLHVILVVFVCFCRHLWC